MVAGGVRSHDRRMPTLAILDDVIPMQLKERPDDLAPMRVVWSGTEVERLREAAASLRPDVLALDLSRLGADPVTEARALADASGAQLLLLLYDFAPREVIREAARSGARPVKTPVRLGSLRTQMTSVIVRGILDGGAASEEEAKTVRPPARSPAPAAPPDTSPRRFSRAQLGRLAEIQSTVDCECPNHLSELLLQLGSFEDYSLACKNRDAKDAAIHAMLHRTTSQARAIVEEALAQLLVHEKIVL
jgi:DNA-binding NarL/FixJ family response regulator